MPKGQHGVRDFADVDVNTTPKQENNKIHGDAFAGNDNNRRMIERRLKATAAPAAPATIEPVAAPIETPAEPATPETVATPVPPETAPTWKNNA